MKNITINRKNGKLTSETITAVAAEICGQFASNTAAKAAKSQIREFYDLGDRETIECLKAANAIRLDNLSKKVMTAKANAFSFAKWLQSGFEILKKDSEFQKLFAIAESRKATSDDLTAFCAKYYAAVAENGEFLKPKYLYRFADCEVQRVKVFAPFETKTANDAVAVLKSAFSGFAKSLKYEISGKGAAFLNVKPVNEIITFEVYDNDAKAFAFAELPENTSFNAFDLSKAEAFEALAVAFEK